MALDTTVGGPSANSYVSVTESNTFFANHYSTVKATIWNALSTAQKEAALKRATQVLDSLRVLDTEYGFGVMPLALTILADYDVTIHRQLENQRLQFPRNIDIDFNDAAFVPQEVKDAQCEQAIYLLAFDESALTSQLSGISEETITAGPVRIRQNFSGQGTYVAPLALELVRQFLRTSRTWHRA